MGHDGSVARVPHHRGHDNPLQSHDRDHDKVQDCCRGMTGARLSVAGARHDRGTIRARQGHDWYIIMVNNDVEALIVLFTMHL